MNNRAAVRRTSLSRIFISLVTCGFLICQPVWADGESDDIIGALIAKSEVVIVGRIEKEPFSIITEVGVVHHLTDVAVTDPLIGADGVMEMRVDICRFELGESERPSFLTKGNEVVLFLTKRPGQNPVWQTADALFGIQQFNQKLIREIKRVSSRRDAPTTAPSQ